MTYLALNGRPVIVGSQLTFIDDKKCLTFNMDYLIVERISSARGVEYITNTGADGSVSFRDLPTLFKHYDPVKVQKLADKQYLLERFTDLFNIPDDRLDDCLDEMKSAIRTLRLAQTAAIAVYEENADCKFTEEDVRAFTRHHIGNIGWTDDGEKSTTVNIDQDQQMVVTEIDGVPVDVEDIFTFRPTLFSQPQSPMTPPSLEVMIEAYFESQRFDIVAADKLKKEYLNALRTKLIQQTLNQEVRNATPEIFKEMDVNRGDNEYFVTDGTIQRIVTIRAFSLEEAERKARFHYGPSAGATWRFKLD